LDVIDTYTDAKQWKDGNSITKAENIASVYGWPIGKWNVSQIEDFPCIFLRNSSFNEDIGL